MMNLVRSSGLPFMDKGMHIVVIDTADYSLVHANSSD